ncbi:MAG: hypothetical protein HY794_18975 [Desulfarculus sp.]|nr:hypothetical protein [Desulfarculus sp.]
MLTQAGRPAFFGGGPAWLFYALAGLALLVFSLNLRARLRRPPAAEPGRPWLLPLGQGPAAQGAWDVCCIVLARVSLLVLLLGSLLWNLHRQAYPFLRGRTYQVYAFTLDLAGGLLLLALLGLMVQRLLRRRRAAGSGLGLALLFWVGLSGLFTEYARLAATRPDWAFCEFLGWLPVVLWSTWGGASDQWLMIIWWMHALPALLLIALAPRLRL